MFEQSDKLLLLLLFTSITTPLVFVAAYKSINFEWLFLVAALVTSSFTTHLGVTFFSHDELYRGTVFGYTVQISDLIYFPLILKTMVNKPSLEAQALGLIYLLLLALMAVSAWTAPVDRHVYSYYAIIEMIKFGLILGLFVTHFTERMLEALVAALLLIAVLHGSSFLWDRYVGGVYRVSGFLHHPNLMGGFVILVAMPLMFLLASPQLGIRMRTFVLMPPTILISLGAILSVSRSVLLMMVAGIVCILLYVALRHVNKALQWGLILLIAAIPLGYKAADTLLQRFEWVGTSDGGRAEMNRLAIKMGLDHLTGVGINNYSLAARNYDTSQFAAMLHDNLPPAHNAFLLMMAETGVPGMLAFGLLFVFPLIQGARAQHQFDPDDWRKYLLLGMMLAILLLLLQSLLEDSLRRSAIMSLLFPYLGILTAAPARLRRERLNALGAA